MQLNIPLIDGPSKSHMHLSAVANLARLGFKIHRADSVHIGPAERPRTFLAAKVTPPKIGLHRALHTLLTELGIESLHIGHGHAAERAVYEFHRDSVTDPDYFFWLH